MPSRAQRLTGPGIVAARVHPVVRARAEEAAAALLDSVMAQHGELSGRGAAARYGIDERVLRDYRDGSRNIPLAFVLALPASVAADVLRACLAEVTLLSSGISPERTHRQIVASVGELSADLDAALADGALDDRERAQHASKLRQLAARCEQGARNVSAVGAK